MTWGRVSVNLGYDEIYAHYLEVFWLATSYIHVYISLSMLHVTIVTISHLVKKVPLLELLHATEFSVRLV